MASLLTTFLAALILAYALRPVTMRLQGFGLHKSISAIFTIFLGFLLIFGITFLFVSVLQKEIPALREQLPALVNQNQHTLSPWLDRLPINLSWPEIQTSLQEKISTHLSNNAENLITSSLEGLLSSGKNLITGALNLILITFVMFYLLTQWDSFLKNLMSIVPRRWVQEVIQICSEIDALLSQYLRGQFFVIALLAFYYALGLHFLGMTGALALGIFTGVAIIIPYLGFMLALCLALLSAALQGDNTHISYVFMLYFAGQILEGFFLTPKLVGERIGLHPVLVIFALMLFGNWFGFFGILLALPISAIALVLSRHGLTKYKASAWYSQ